jgi:hypothetical protein
MAAIIKGTAHLYGVSGTYANANVLSFRKRTTTANNGTTEDENGNVIERRYDDVTNEATITLRMESTFAAPAVADEITYDGIKYIVVDVEESQQNKGFRESTLNLITSEGITLA